MNSVLLSEKNQFGLVNGRGGFKWTSANKITASNNLPTGSVSASISIDNLDKMRQKSEDNFSKVRISSSGLLCPDYNGYTPSESWWIRQLKLTPNIHFQNAVLELNKGNKLRVRVTADIEIGQEVNLWFGQEILVAMQIPFLNPINIRGQNCYECHICDKVYEDPNPLKIHLARNCDKYSMDVLWSRLKNSFPPSVPLTEPETMTRSTRLSAFHPVSPPASAFSYSDADHLAASHLETIVSNMGTSKQGHLCIYCGKLYSRKYGLKIHIRTHTGFKPLKCKFCSRPFGDPSNLNKHMRLHLQHQIPTTVQQKYYRCHLCDKVMIRKRDLQRHIELRHFPEEHQEGMDFSDTVSNVSSCSSSNDEMTVV